MTNPTVAHEAERLRVLYQYEILDTIAERAFDELAELASAICGTPIATITLVDRERQWFKAAVGLPRGETPREVSFCAHAVGGSELMEVRDALDDERFVRNPLVTGEPHIRFYAGAPLMAGGGHAIGTICVIDRIPRELTALQQQTLAILSRQVVSQLELRRSLRNVALLNSEREAVLLDSWQRSEELAAERSEKLHAEMREHEQTGEALKLTRAQFVEAQKMEALGQLAGGIAHDFNNILTAIMGYSTLLYEAIPPPQREDSHAAEILRAAERGASLSRQLLTLSRKRPYEASVFDPELLIGSVLKLLRQVIGDRIVLETDVESLECVNADAGQIEQVLLNLAINARDAMPAGGTVSVVGRNVSLEHDQAPISTCAHKFVAITVKDNGTGIPPDVQPRIFEPFFTTKRAGQGTGLGLATCRTIAQQSGGWIECKSKLGEGAAFTIYIPAVEEKAPPLAPAEAGQATGGSETILVVEDEPAVGELVGLLLSSLGYDVIHAEDGDAARQAVAARQGRIDLVLTDVNMPRMDGRELIRRLSVENPDVKVILTSGNEVDEADMPSHLPIEFLPKPFTMQTLGRKVREILDAR